MTEKQTAIKSAKSGSALNSVGIDPNNNNFQIFFPAASQPDIIRSVQKDQFYVKQLSEQIFDVATKIIGISFIKSHLQGPRLAMKLQREVSLISELSYYTLTTILGKTRYSC